MGINTYALAYYPESDLLPCLLFTKSRTLPHTYRIEQITRTNSQNMLLEDYREHMGIDYNFGNQSTIHFPGDGRGSFNTFRTPPIFEHPEV